MGVQAQLVNPISINKPWNYGCFMLFFLNTMYILRKENEMSLKFKLRIYTI